MTHAHHPTDNEIVAAQLRVALESRDLAAYGAMLDDNVRWGGAEDAPETCRSRAEVLDRLAVQRADGLETQVIEVVPGEHAILLGIRVKRPVRDGFSREHDVYQVLSVRNQCVVDIRGYATRPEAAAHAGIASREMHAMQARQVTPILNVSNIDESFDWFARLGWARRWDWRPADGPATFGAVGSGQCEVMLCLNGQGGRGRAGGIGGAGQGVWLSIWVDDVDIVHEVCVREGLEVVRPPRDEPWGLREMHLRHPDGHVFRISQERHTH